MMDLMKASDPPKSDLVYGSPANDYSGDIPKSLVPAWVSNKDGIGVIRPGASQMPSHWVVYNFKEADQPSLTGKDDIVLVTMATAGRFIPSIDQIMCSWSGRIHLAYYVKDLEDLQILENWSQTPARPSDVSEVTTCPYDFPTKRLTVHLVFAEPSEPFPINTLRNVAQFGVPTSHVFHADIDFVPMMGLREKLLSDFSGLLECLHTQKLMLVVPSFEMAPTRKHHSQPNKEENGENEGAFPKPTGIPRTARDAKKLFAKGSIQPFHKLCIPCQQATRYDRWLTATQPYRLKFESSMDIPETYEPYVIVSNKTVPWNERFAGYGKDKTFYYFHLRSILNYSTVVLPDVFIFHMDHRRSADAQRFRKASSKGYRKSRLAIFEQEKMKLIRHYREQNQLSDGLEDLFGFGVREAEVSNQELKNSKSAYWKNQANDESASLELQAIEDVAQHMDHYSNFDKSTQDAHINTINDHGLPHRTAFHHFESHLITVLTVSRNLQC
ncbi:glycosyl-transferase for dystroglycan-domain-containing protein [Cladochytrium replicatum]|nr:glycosyl-transferase for dystroglycan-domain-containing protein [Cladochytrium replicatum]